MQPPPVIFATDGRRHALYALNWPTYSDARTARDLAVEAFLIDRQQVDAALARRIAGKLGCLPGEFLLKDRNVEAAPVFVGAYASLQRRLALCLTRRAYDSSKVRPYTVAHVARRDGLPLTMDGLRMVGAVLRATAGPPDTINGGKVWRLPEAFFGAPPTPPTRAAEDPTRRARRAEFKVKHAALLATYRARVARLHVRYKASPTAIWADFRAERAPLYAAYRAELAALRLDAVDK